MTDDRNRKTSGNEETDGVSIVWFRNDLRIADNPALHAAFERKEPLICIFVLESDNGLRPLGSASRWWLHHSLKALAQDLKKAGAELLFFEGKSGDIVPKLAKESEAGVLLFNRRYGGSGRDLDDAIEKKVAGDSCRVESFNGRLLNEPWEIETKSGSAPYGVFTPYWKAIKAKGLPHETLPKHTKFKAASYPKSGAPKPCSLEDLDLLPTKPNWSEGWDERWTPGESGAGKRLRDFLKTNLKDYDDERNVLASTGTSHLSPHLRFGEISPRQVVAAVKDAETKSTAKDADSFLSEIAWREFDYHVMYFNPDVAEKNLHEKFDDMPWKKPSKADLDAWQKGQTGFPIVDAGMRELWQTGYMHNRLRMITASFLIKDLMCDWRIGEKWFWDCLCDADPANNTMNWQWVAGSGADASPFFRVFNPISQGEKYDPDGDYVRRWVPELAKLEGKSIHAPWEVDESDLEEAGIELGTTYPKPILDHKKGREDALEAYQKIK